METRSFYFLTLLPRTFNFLDGWLQYSPGKDNGVFYLLPGPITHPRWFLSFLNVGAYQGGGYEFPIYCNSKDYFFEIAKKYSSTPTDSCNLCRASAFRTHPDPSINAVCCYSLIMSVYGLGSLLWSRWFSWPMIFTLAQLMEWPASLAYLDKADLRLQTCTEIRCSLSLGPSFI